MQNRYYVVDGIDVRLVKCQVFEDNKTVRIFTTARPYDIPFGQMPKFLQSWIPVRIEGVESYDHISAEMGIIPPADNSRSAVAKLNADIEQDDDEESEQVLILRELYVDMLKNQVTESAFIKQKLKEAIMNLKDEKNTLNKNYVEQAKQINNIAANTNKLTITNMQMLLQGINLFKGKKAKFKTKPKDGEAGNDHAKD